jgi:phospholipid/cholesterol/gamma-HCH transport system substrate-binding protein
LKVSNETKIGALTAVAITLLLLGYSYLKGNDIFSGTNKFYAVYKSVDGLAVSKPVLVNGFQIGRVSHMELLQNGHTVVEFKIDKQYEVPKNSTAKLASTDILGGKAIVFIYSNNKEFAENKDTLQAEIQGSLTESLQPIQTKAESLISKLDSSLAAVNKILNPNLQKNIDRSFMSIANSLQTLESVTKKIDGLVGSQTGHINGILSNAETMSVNLKTSTSKLNDISSNLNKFSGDLANSNIKQTLDNANKAVASLQEAISKINSGDGSVAKLLNDGQLYKNLNDASANLNNLFIDIKAHPKNYVSFSVFGGGKKKDN